MLPADTKRRIPVYVSILVVLACVLIGYGLSLAVPLNRAPAPPATAVTKPEPAKGVEAKPARQDSSYANAGSGASAAGRETAAGKPASATPAASVDQPARLGRVEPAAAKAPAQASGPVPAVETGSVEHAAQRAAVPPGDTTAARPAETPEAADSQPGAKQAQTTPRKKVRRVYRRAQPRTAKGPFEQLFPALAK